MYDAILFDLDGTLLALDNDRFVKYYFKALAPHLAPYFGDRDFTKPVLYGTEAMMKSDGKNGTLRQVFNEAFDKQSPVPFAQLEPVFLNFYRTDFNQVKAISNRKNLAQPVLEAAQRLTSRIVLATVPVFPLVAIEARLNWAGLETFPFSLITSFENMQYSKPNPSYYLEIADRLNVRPENCLMIGNDCIDDLAAGVAGMETYLVLDDALNLNLSAYTPTYSGSMVELLDFMAQLAG
jgi:FMN phosphatase YigB (HAD superfamily)